MGACMLEKHITLDRTMRGPDHAASLEPDTFAAQVKAVREVESALGVSHRWITQGEMLNRRVLAKSLVAATDLGAGTIITRQMVTSKSPGMGLSAQLLDQLIGQQLKRDLCRDEAFTETDLEDGARQREMQAVDIGIPWGVIARFTDIDGLVRRFANNGMSLVEFHVSDRDLDLGIEAFQPTKYPFALVVHAPEYFGDHLIDLCASETEHRRISVGRIQKTVNLARQLAPWFADMSDTGPKVVIHVGGMSPERGTYDVARATEYLLDSLRQLDVADVDLLLENLPPFPWYFGGRWFGHVLVDAATTAQVCTASGLGLCFDTSHAALECHRSGVSLRDFGQLVSPYVKHLHLSDAAGVSGEGLQIGEGEINFIELMPLLFQMNATCVPEIWMGHHREGAGFQTALERLTEIVWATKSLTCARTSAIEVELQHLIVSVSTTVGAALQVIDENTVGTAFVVSEQGVMQGVVTDGDIRRALLAGKSLRTPVAKVMNRDFVFALDDMDPVDVRARLSERIRVLPILDSAHRLVNFTSIHKFFSSGKDRG